MHWKIAWSLISLSGIASLANEYKGLLSADEGCHYDRIIEINLDTVRMMSCFEYFVK